MASLVFDAMEHLGPGGVACLTGVSGGKHALAWTRSMLNRAMVLENQAVVGSVNANRRHYEAAAEALLKADHDLALEAGHDGACRSSTGRTRWPDSPTTSRW